MRFLRINFFKASWRQYLLHIVIISVVFIADFVSKLIIYKIPIESYHYTINQFFNIVMVKNHGITFGMLNALKMPYLINIISILILIYIVTLYKKSSKYEQSALSMIIGGALGNIIDRIINGSVLDFIDIHYKQYHWYVFNVADIAVCIGVGLLILLELGKVVKNK